ncbi:hypothetical protein ACWV26_17365 [Rummeliibacillus sp. JY-2-4R]
MYKVGIVGPARSVERILYYANKFETNLSFAGYSYNLVDETTDILNKYHSDVDFWLFSGLMPYQIAKQSKYFSKNQMEYIFYAGDSFRRGLLEVSYEIGKLARRASMDILSTIENNDSFDGVEGLTKILDHLYVKRFTAKTSTDEIIAYHEELWNKQEIDVVITVYPIVEEKLKEKGIPVHWIGPSKQDIFHALQLFSEKIQTSYYKETQTTALVVQIKNFNSIKMAHENGYAIHFLQLTLKKIILLLCEKIDGYLIEEGNGHFVILSSRGIVERNRDAISEMVDRLSVETDEAVVVGIGHAQTVYYAESNAHHAMLDMLEKSTNGIVVMQEDGTITEMAQASPEFTYQSRVQDMKMIDTLEQTSVSVRMFTKIEAILHELKIDAFSAKVLAKELSMTERYAQRIISELVKVNLIEYCGEDNRKTRGRPAKLYKLKE